MNKQIQIILIAGGSCSGKTEYAKWFKNSEVIIMDDFYVGKSKMQKNKNGEYDFDSPSAVNLKECADIVKTLKEKGEAVSPVYDMKTSERVGTRNIKLKKEIKFIVVEGLFVLYEPLRELGDIKIFIDTPADIRVARRMLRDVKRRGFSDIQTLKDFVGVEEGYKKYVEPTREFADLVVPYSHNPLAFGK